MMRAKARLKVEGRAKPIENVFVVVAYIIADCKAKTRVNGGPPTSASRRKSLGNCEEEEDQESPQNVQLDMVDLEKPCHRCHMHLGSRRQGFQDTQRCAAGRLGTPAMVIAETKSLHSLIVGTGGKSSLTFCSKRIPGQQHVSKPLSSAKGCSSVNFPVCGVCQKFGEYDQHLPRTAPQCDASSEEECQPDGVPLVRRVVV